MSTLIEAKVVSRPQGKLRIAFKGDDGSVALDAPRADLIEMLKGAVANDTIGFTFTLPAGVVKDLLAQATAAKDTTKVKKVRKSLGQVGVSFGAPASTPTK